MSGSLLALQLFSLVIGAIAKIVSTPAHPLHLDAGFSLNALARPSSSRSCWHACSRKARAIRFSTLDAICGALSCQPGDILRFEPDAEREPVSNKEN